MNNIDSILEKAFTTGNLASGGLLEPEQAAKLVQGIFENAVISVEARREPMKALKKQIDKITFVGNVLQKPLAVGTEHTTTTDPTTSKVILDAQEAIIAIDLGYDAMEDSIEGGNIQDTIIELASKALGYEFDRLILNGDTAGGSGDFLEILDGILKQVTTNVHDQLSATMDDQTLFDALKLLPSQYFNDPADWRFWVHHKAKLDYINFLASKNVNDAFSKYLIEAKEPAYQGIPVRKVGGTDEVLGKSSAILTRPENVVLGIHRDIMWEFERKPRHRILQMTMTMRVDVKLEREDAAVKIINILHSV